MRQMVKTPTVDSQVIDLYKTNLCTWEDFSSRSSRTLLSLDPVWHQLFVCTFTQLCYQKKLSRLLAPSSPATLPPAIFYHFKQQKSPMLIGISSSNRPKTFTWPMNSSVYVVVDEACFRARQRGGGEGVRRDSALMAVTCM